MSEKLKPCPFCGGEAYTTITEDGHFWVARCRDCHAQIMLCNKEWQAIKMWNRRYLNWEKTSERTPEPKQKVLIIIGKSIDIGYLCEEEDKELDRIDRWWHIVGAENVDIEVISYWMPLPELPEVKE